MTESDPKQRAAQAAIDEIRDGMIVGLGTGSTSEFFLTALGEAIRERKLKDIRSVATSQRSAIRARELNIPVLELTADVKIDVTIDGADEIGPGLNLIKGLGGALLREKIVAQNSKRVVIIADSAKLVQSLGTRGPLPVEVVPFAHESHEAFFTAIGSKPSLRMQADGSPFITDNGNYIYDCRFGKIDVPAVLEMALRKRAGVVESGLFIAIAHSAIIGYDDRVERI